MAGQFEQIRISGVFKDNITPVIKKINAQMVMLQKNVAALSTGRGKQRTFAFFKEAAEAIEKMSVQLDRTTASLANYRRQALGVARANARIARAGGMSFPSAPRQAPRANAAPAPAPAAAPAALSERGLGIFGATAASAFGNLIANAITGAFQWSANLLRNVFGKFFGAFQERIDDQMSDIQSAGGIYATALKNNIKEFGTTFDGAMEFQKELNSELAKAAGALPGETGDYVRTAKGLTDGLMITIGKDAENFKTAFSEGTGSLSDAMKNALSQLTTKSTLLGLTQQGGIPLPVLIERILSQDQVNIQSMASTFAALEQNPLMKSALQDAEKDINAAGANTAKRLEVVIKALDAALPPEQINAMKRATKGLTEAYKSFFLDPDSGMFGLGRSLGIELKAYSSQTGLATGAKTTMGLFDLLNDIFSNIAVVFGEGLPILMEFFDPLTAIGELFVDLRETSFDLYSIFNSSTRYFKKQAKAFGMEAEEFGVGTRSFLSTMIIFLKRWGGFTQAEADRYLGILKSSKELEKGFKQELFTKIWKRFINSDFVMNIARSLGEGAGLMVKSLSNMVMGITEATGDPSGPIAVAFKAFSDSGAPQAFGAMVKDILSRGFEFVKNAALSIAKQNPVATASTLAMLYAVFNPGAITGLILAPFGKIGELLAGGMAFGSTDAVNDAVTGGLLSPLKGGLMKMGVKMVAFLANPMVWIPLAIIAVGLLGKFFREPIVAFGRNFAAMFAKWASQQTGIFGVAMRFVADELARFWDLINGVLKFFGGLIDFVWGLLTGDWELVWKGIKDMMEGFGETLWALVEGLIEKVLGPFRWVAKKVGILEEETKRETKKEERTYKRNHARFLRNTFPNLSGMNATGYGSIGAAATAGRSSSSVGSSSIQVPNLGSRSFTWSSGRQGTIPEWTFKNAGTANYSTLIPLVTKLAGQWDSREGAGRPQFESQAWSLGNRTNRNSLHGVGRALDVGDANTSPQALKNMYWWMRKNLKPVSEGGILDELFYDPVGSEHINGGRVQKGAFGGHDDHLHLGWKAGANLPAGISEAAKVAPVMHNYQGYLTPLLEEARNMPAGARLAVANTSEAVLNREQIRGMFEGLSSGKGGGISIGTINVSGGNAQELARQVVDEIERQVMQSKMASIL